MPEIKNQFTGGKMNKDVDERLVPKGEYRDAMNIQVSTSEGSDVGTVQNILGNKLINISPVTISSNSICIGAVSDEKNDAFYWFVKEDGIKDIIFEYKLGLVKPVFVDTKVGTDNAVLKFTDKPITGINIIDGMIFWTDSYSEPKKINIERSIEGTNLNGNTHTSLINPFINISPNNPLDIKEDHITVIRKAPKSALTVRTEADPNFAYGTTNSATNFLSDPANPILGNIPIGNDFDLILLKDSNSTTELQIGDSVLFNPNLSSVLPNDEHQVKANLVSIVNDGSSDFMSGGTVLYLAGTYEIWTLSMVSIGNVSSNNLTYNWAVQFAFNDNFKNIFPRFSYRYKYIDGEYSSFAPFTTVVFETKSFLYDIKEAFNKGMENNISKIFVGNYNNNIPKDVKSLDIIYKESNSPSVYIVDTIEGVNMTATRSIGQTPEYEVRPNQIKALLPENQLLRSYDNVPKSALAQEISGSRVIYANYLQNYDIDITPSVSASLRERKQDYYPSYGGSKKSLKSIRNYSLGVSYLDRYGRQTPVFTDKKGDVQINIDKSNNSNQVSTRVYGTAPEWAEYYKIFVKDTSTEYYNLAMDRLYDARDGNVWLSFPSSDRNKVDDETFLILKKGVSEGDAVDEDNKYKILAIENEAPDFIKTELKSYGRVTEGGVAVNLFQFFTVSSGYPLPSRTKIMIDKANWDTNSLGLPEDGKFELRFSTLAGGTILQQTDFYEVVSFEAAPNAEYTFILKKPITEQWLEGATATVPDLNIGIEVFKKEVENKPQFDGRFFVKVSRDIYINNYIVSQAIQNLSVTQQPSVEVPFFYLADGGNGSVWNGSSAITNDYQEWQDFYDNTTAEKSCWFIDQAYYAGYFSPNENTFLNNYGIPFSPLDDPNYQATGKTGASSGYNRGIWTDPATGKTWMYLSFGYIKCEDGSSFFNNENYLQSPPPFSVLQTQQAHDNRFGTSLTNGFGSLEALTGGTYDHENNDDNIDIWKVGDPVLNPLHGDQQEVVLKLQAGEKFRFTGGTDIYVIKATPELYYHLSWFNTDDIQGLRDAAHLNYLGNPNNIIPTSYWMAGIHNIGHSNNRRITYRIEIGNLDPNLPDNPTDPSSSFNPLSTANTTTSGGIQFLEEVWESLDDQIVSENPAIWETEPKQDIDLDIYREVDGTFPIEINNDTNYIFAPVGSKVVHPDTSIIPAGTEVVSWDNNILKLNVVLNDSNMNQTNGSVYFHRPDGSCVSAELLFLHNPFQSGGVNNSDKVVINPNVLNKTVDLSWFNCYSFENGVESDRVRDDFNQVRIDKGAKASSTIDEPYEEEHRKYGLIYSGLYNSISGVNNLNQFIAAEKITKDVNPTYGSIQKLFSRDSDLIAMCEDKTLKILANKDAVFNADGNPQLTANQNVLGQTIPFVGDYGISTNPESFASESYRAYFTDKVRGTVMRLSKDGLTPISEHGMKDYFRDNLKLSNKLIGSYDDKKNEYNLTLEQTTEQIPKTVSFKENVRGWVSFKSFVPEYAISCANEYYTFKSGNSYKHHDESQPRNTFYATHTSNDYSSVTTILNDAPQLIKSFNTINYEGSQSKVDQFVADAATGLTDGQYYNLDPKKGWYANSIFTNKETGSVSEFIEKEGKWFNYIKGNDVQHVGNVDILVNNDGSSSFDQASFAVQGLGTFDGTPVIQTNVYGCTDVNATNYNPAATVDDGSCITIGNAIYGCMEPTATNYNSVVTANDNSCLWMGCTDVTAINTTLFPPIAYTYNSGNSILDDGTCVSIALGCTDAAAFNYDPTANTDDGSCIQVVLGCTDALAINYSATANTDDGSCNYNGCTNPLATNYEPLATTDDGSCLGGGCTSQNASNYDATATFDDGSCIILTPGCTDAVALNYNSNAQVDDGSCLYSVPGCTDALASNYNPSATTDDGSCTYPVSGCTDQAAFNYNPAALTDDGSCIAVVFGCTDSTATNYNAAANTDNGSCTYAPPPVVGCMDPTACNYDINATQQGFGSADCFWAIAGITVGDPTVGPVFYDDFLNPVANDTDKKVKHYVIGPTWPLTSSSSNDIGLSMKEGYNPTSWPPSLANLTSFLGVSGNTVNGVNHPVTKARVNLYKKDDPTNASSNWTLVHSLPSSQFVWNQNFFGGDTPGQGGPVLPKLFRDRLLSGQPMTGSAPHQPPYPWGPGQQDPNNYEFSVYYDNNGNKNIYKVEVYLSYYNSVYGISNGVLNADGTTCGTSYQFEIHDAACLENPFAVSGCTDPNACNHDQYATCDDGSCYYTSTPFYTPDPTGLNNCFACEAPGAGCNPSIPDCPLNSLGNLDFWSSSNNPTGNIFVSQGACDTTVGANITSDGAN